MKLRANKSYSNPDSYSLIQTLGWQKPSTNHQPNHEHLAGARREYAVLTQSYMGTEHDPTHTHLVSVQFTEVSCKRWAVLAFFGRRGRVAECELFCKTSLMPNISTLGFGNVLGDNS